MSIDHLSHQFQKVFSNQHEYISFAPGRVNLLGEHVDYMGGTVLPAAIDKGIWILARPEPNTSLNITSGDFNESITWDSSILNAKKPEGWQSYAWGVLKEMAKMGFPWLGGDLLISGNLPIGSGLSSSAALEIALTQYFLNYYDFKYTSKELALITQRIENQHVGTSCGIMDMFASIHGKKNHFITLNCNSLEYQHSQIDLEAHEWILINSMVRHQLGNAYNLIRQELEQAEQIIQQGPLVSLELEQLESHKNLLSPSQYSRALHVVSESIRTKEFIQCSQQNNLSKIGTLLQETHWSLSQDLKVSTKELDELIHISQDIPGWVGGRLMGGGFGGCTINLVQKNHSQDYIQHIKHAYKTKLNLECEAYSVQLSEGAWIKHQSGR